MNGIPILDSIPVNWFILGVSILAGVILFLILTQIPDEDEEKKEEETTPEPDLMLEPEEVTSVKKPKKKKRKLTSRRP